MWKTLLFKVTNRTVYTVSICLYSIAIIMILKRLNMVHNDICFIVRFLIFVLSLYKMKNLSLCSTGGLEGQKGE